MYRVKIAVMSLAMAQKRKKDSAGTAPPRPSWSDDRGIVSPDTATVRPYGNGHELWTKAMERHGTTVVYSKHLSDTEGSKRLTLLAVPDIDGIYGLDSLILREGKDFVTFMRGSHHTPECF